MTSTLGQPRLHLRRTDSTNDRARALAQANAPSGTLVTASEQTAGRGRQGRAWLAAPGSSLLMSLLLRWPPSEQAPALLPLLAGVAVCDVAGESAAVKWPNDVVVRRDTPSQDVPRLAKLAGVLVEGRPQEGWAVLGIGVNVAMRIEDLPAELRDTAASLQRPQGAVEPLLEELLQALERRLSQPRETLLDAWRARDALRGREISWESGGGTAQGGSGTAQRRAGTAQNRSGTAQGVDDRGRLLVRLPDGTMQTLSSGEVHLGPAA